MIPLRESALTVIRGIRLCGGEIQTVRNCVTLVGCIGDFEGRIGHYHFGVIVSSLDRKRRYHFNTDSARYQSEDTRESIRCCKPCDQSGFLVQSKSLLFYNTNSQMIVRNRSISSNIFSLAVEPPLSIFYVLLIVIV